MRGSPYLNIKEVLIMIHFKKCGGGKGGRCGGGKGGRKGK